MGTLLCVKNKQFVEVLLIDGHYAKQLVSTLVSFIDNNFYNEKCESESTEANQ